MADAGSLTALERVSRPSLGSKDFSPKRRKERTPEETAGALQFKAELTRIKKALSDARSKFAGEMRTAKVAKKDSSGLSTFPAYQAALNEYLTLVMRTQGLQGAEMARIAEVGFLGAIDREKHKEGVWGGIAAAGAVLGPIQTLVGATAGVAINKFVYTPASKTIVGMYTSYRTESVVSKRVKEAAKAAKEGVDFKTLTGSANLLEKNLPARFREVSRFMATERRARLGLSIGTGATVGVLTGAGLSGHFAHDEMFAGESVRDVLAEQWGAFGRWLVDGFRPQATEVVVIAAVGAGKAVESAMGSPAMAAEMSPVSGVAPLHGSTYQLESTGTRTVFQAVPSPAEAENDVVRGRGIDPTSGQTMPGQRFFVAPPEGAPDPFQSMPTPEKPVLVDHLGGAPWNIDRNVALDDAHIERAIPLMNQGGLSHEWNDDVEALLRQQRALAPSAREIVPIQDERFDGMLYRGGVIGEGARDVELHTPKPYNAEYRMIERVLSDGKIHRLEIYIPEDCNNITWRDTIVGEPPAPLVIPPPVVEAAPPAQGCPIPGDTQWTAKELQNPNGTHIRVGSLSLERSPGGYTAYVPSKEVIPAKLAEILADAKRDGLFDDGRDFILVEFNIYNPVTCTYESVVICVREDAINPNTGRIAISEPFIAAPGSADKVPLTAQNFNQYIERTRVHGMHDNAPEELSASARSPRR